MKVYLLPSSVPIRLVLLLVLLSGVYQLKAGIINTDKDVCLGNLTYFKVKGVTGINTVKWAFGDGFTSKNQNASHLYKSAGKYNVVVEVSTSSGNLKDSMEIEVHVLPIAILSQFKIDSCLYTNSYEFQDFSTPSSTSNKIVKRLVVWGDGAFDLDVTRNYGDYLAHHYEMTDIYKVKMEITDNKGCKASTIKNVKVVNGTKAKINSKVDYPSCGVAEVCFKSESKTSNGSNQTYIWKFDNGPAQSLSDTSIRCFRSSTSKSVKAILIMSNPDNTCMTSDTVNVALNTDSVSGNFTLNDSIFCYGSSEIIINAPAAPGFSYTWMLDSFKLDHYESSLSMYPKEINAYPGLHKIICTVKRGPCSLKFEKTFKVIGPVARMRIFNKNQCGIDYKVFFIDTSLNLNKKHAQFYWTVEDPEGENCEIFRAINQNKYKNCNRSRDWFGKHDYTVPRKYNPIRLRVLDTLSGCMDSTSQNMEHFHCLLCNRGGAPINLCQGEMFLPLNDREIGPQRFSLDTGKTWLKFPSIIDKPYKGLYGVMFEFKRSLPEWAEDFGDDSIKVHRSDTSWLDTIFISDFLFVKENLDTSISLTLEKGCNPFIAKLNFEDSSFNIGDEIEINWKDGQTQLIYFDKDSIMKEVSHPYYLSGMDTFIDVRLKSHEGCTRTKYIILKFGKKIKCDITGNPCVDVEICFQAEIVNWLNHPKYLAFKKVSWMNSEDSSKTYTGTNYCTNFKNPGFKTVKLMTEDSLGCQDTVEFEMPIRKVRAGIVEDSRISYCSELKQLFDSSYHVFMVQGDRIDNYYWDFGSGKYTTAEKDPFRSFDLFDSIIKTYHVATDNNGCTDTFRFNFKLVGSFPKFEMIDTMGCSPLKVTFKNLSSKCSSYIWEYDDQDNTTMDETEKRDGTMIYDKPGKYYPKLIGIDTFYNPYTGAVYYCHETYDPKHAVTVFETKFASLEFPDTVCVGQDVTFNCEANTQVVYWDLGDGTKETRGFYSYRIYRYNNAGTYLVQYAPVFNFPTGQFKCIDSFSKAITVVGVKADFEIKNTSQAPIFHFKNLSQPNYASIWWDFGHRGSSSNNSSDQEPSHNYQRDTGTFNVCLIANVFNLCRDTLCKPIYNDYYQSLQLFNVFTPGVNDGLNDEYDIPINGESQYLLTIYDRWGVVVYSSDIDGEIGDGINWNGKLHNSGIECPSGTYYYIFNYAYKINPDEKGTLNGTITLIR